MQHKFHVPDMSCGHCSSTIEAAILAHDPLAELRFDMAPRAVEIECDLDQSALLAVLNTAGYPARAIDT